MISLARHIQLLLLEHDCIIVPNLGGFIANHVEACYNEAGDALFLPPYRTIGFNPQLQVNDGLLVQSYMNAYDASYPAAYLQMEQDVEKMLAKLDKTGEYELEGVGILKKSLNNSITFTSFESGVLTPSLFGLYSFEMKSLTDVVNEKKAQELLNNKSELLVEEQKEESKPITITLYQKWIDVAVSAAAAIVLFFGLSFSALHDHSSEADTCIATACTVTPNSEVINKKAETKQQKNNKVDKSSEKTTDESAAKKADEEKKKTSVPENNIQVDSKFAIVLASYVSRANATEYIEKLKANGFPDARFIKNGKVSRILYSGYKTEEEAYNALSELRKQSSDFAEAWVIAL